MGFWDSFAEGFIPAFQQGLERNHEVAQQEAALSAKRREQLLGLVAGLQKKRAEVGSESAKYENSVKALSTRLMDEDGNLIPGAEALLSDPLAAHKTLTKIEEIEQKAAEDDNAY